MTCKDCGAQGDDLYDFLVATPIWNYVMSGQEETTLTVRDGLFPETHAGRLMPRSEGVGGVVCLLCFDRRAREMGIEYRQSLIALGGSCWMGGHFEDGLPLVMGDLNA